MTRQLFLKIPAALLLIASKFKAKPIVEQTNTGISISPMPGNGPIGFYSVQVGHWFVSWFWDGTAKGSAPRWTAMRTKWDDTYADNRNLYIIAAISNVGAPSGKAWLPVEPSARAGGGGELVTLEEARAKAWLNITELITRIENSNA